MLQPREQLERSRTSGVCFQTQLLTGRELGRSYRYRYCYQYTVADGMRARSTHQYLHNGGGLQVSMEPHSAFSSAVPADQFAWSNRYSNLAATSLLNSVVQAAGADLDTFGMYDHGVTRIVSKLFVNLDETFPWSCPSTISHVKFQFAPTL